MGNLMAIGLFVANQANAPGNLVVASDVLWTLIIELMFLQSNSPTHAGRSAPAKDDALDLFMDAKASLARGLLS
jgi:hypothetical protein